MLSIGLVVGLAGVVRPLSHQSFEMRVLVGKAHTCKLFGCCSTSQTVLVLSTSFRKLPDRAMY
jgi:hypothetical protein